MLNRQYARQSELDLSRLMGTAICRRPVSATGGNGARLQSTFGWHVMKIDTRHAAQQVAFEPLIERVARDYQKMQRQEALAAAWEELRAAIRLSFAD